jgi:hypothetical protein
MVLQLCGRVCRRLSFKNPVSNETGFFVLYYFVVKQQLLYVISSEISTSCLLVALRWERHLPI